MSKNHIITIKGGKCIDLDDFEKDYYSMPITALIDKYDISRSTVYENLVPRFTDKKSKRQNKSKDVVFKEYPKFDIIKFPLTGKKRDVEDMGIVIADWHIAKETESYNLEVCAARAKTLVQHAYSIIDLHSPINRIFIFNLGDTIQGENRFQGSKIGETSCGAFEQIHYHAVPLLSEMLVSLKQAASEVNYYSVDGNHGAYDNQAPSNTNWDRFVSEELKSAMCKQPNINIYPPETFYRLINISGFRFFIIHGDQVKAQQGIPLIAMRRKMQEWYAYVGGFNYAYAGHFHVGGFDTINSMADYTLCPPMITGDSWALETVGRASKPQQLCFGIHASRGRSWEYKLYTDDRFLPNKFIEPEGIIKPIF